MNEVEVEIGLKDIEKNIINIKKDNKLSIKTEEKLIEILDGPHYIYNIQSICRIIDRFAYENLIDELYNKLLRYYSENYEWEDYERCIRHFMEYYKVFGLPKRNIEKFFQKLSHAIHMAGDSYENYPLKAAKGINEIKNNISYLKEDDLMTLLNVLETQAVDEMRARQIDAVIEYSCLEDRKFKKKLKGFYIDRLGVEKYIVKTIKRIIYRNLNEEYIELEIDKEDLLLNGEELPIQRMIKKDNKNESVHFGKKYLGYDKVEFFIKINQDYKTIVLVELDYEMQAMYIEYASNKQLNLNINGCVYKEELEKCKEMQDMLNNTIVEVVKGGNIDVERDLLLPTDVIIDYEAAKRALEAANDLMKAENFTESVDRAHTAFHGYIKSVCKTLENRYPEDYGDIFGTRLDLKDVAITKLFKFIRTVILKEHSVDEGVNSMLNSMAALVENINTIRNHKTMTHPNDELLTEDDSRVVLGTIRILMQYIQNKTRKVIEEVVSK